MPPPRNDTSETLDAAAVPPVRGGIDFPPSDLAHCTAATLAERARVSMEAEWALGNRVPAEWYFEHASQLAGDAAALDVIFLEFVLRQDHGEEPTAEQFADRFP